MFWCIVSFILGFVIASIIWIIGILITRGKIVENVMEEKRLRRKEK